MIYDIQCLHDNDSPQRVNEFINYLETIKGKSANTLDAYKIDLNLFFRFIKIYKGIIKDKNVEFEDIKIDDIDDSVIKALTLSDLYAFISFLILSYSSFNQKSTSFQLIFISALLIATILHILYKI